MIKEHAHSFGFQQVDPQQKSVRIRDLFGEVAVGYDLMNDLMSFGFHRLWKKHLLDLIRPHPSQCLVDVAGGTGDIALHFIKRGGGVAYLCDITWDMLGVGRQKAYNMGILDAVKWIVGNAEQLPLDRCSMDVYTIAFGLRNVTHIECALQEAYRVLKPGGRFFCLEFSRLQVACLRPVYRQYLLRMLPFLGQVVLGKADAYRYLAQSIILFPEPEILSQHIQQSGLSQVRYRYVCGGIAVLHSAWRL